MISQYIPIEMDQTKELEDIFLENIIIKSQKNLKTYFFENIIIKIQNQSFISAIMSSHCAISPHLLCALSTANQFQKHHLLETPLHSDLFVRISLKK